MIKVKIDYHPRDYCYQCMFCRNNTYGESECTLMDLKRISYPEFDRPEWCPFNDAEQTDDA